MSVSTGDKSEPLFPASGDLKAKKDKEKEKEILRSYSQVKCDNVITLMRYAISKFDPLSEMTHKRANKLQCVHPPSGYKSETAEIQ